VLADASIRDRLVDRMTRTLVDFYGADPKVSTDFGRVVNAQHLDRLRGLLESAGGTIAVGGTIDEDIRYVAPTIVVDPDLEAPIMAEEIFGPILPVLAVESMDEAVRFVNERPKPLALYVFSGSGDVVDDVLDRTTSGGACVNQTLIHILPSDLPFGGVGPSGMGAYHGQLGFDTFSHLRSVLYKPQKPDPKILYPPYTAFKDKLVHKVL
jgi:aldehyde dehydrogenase (NAD+)